MNFQSVAVEEFSNPTMENNVNKPKTTRKTGLVMRCLTGGGNFGTGNANDKPPEEGLFRPRTEAGGGRRKYLPVGDVL